MNQQEFIEEVKEMELIKFEDAESDSYPVMSNMSAAFIYQFLPIPNEKLPPEFIYVKESYQPDKNKRSHEITSSIAMWNMAWESRQVRNKFLTRDFPQELEWLNEIEDRNIYLLPYHKGNNYYAYQSILNLLPAKIRNYNSLPLFKKGIWPSELSKWYLDDLIPNYFDKRLSEAFSYYIWPFINSSSRKHSFSEEDPILILSHNLNYWVPFLNSVIEEELDTFNRVDIESEEQRTKILDARRDMPNGVELHRPKKGGIIWEGEEEARLFTQRMVNKADKHGKLREIIDAVRSNRIQDDFSDKWSFEKEDFERKIYKKRSKFKVTFVEIKDTIPVHSPNSEIEENLIWEDFLALLDVKEKNIVICLKNGITKMTEISEKLGYANHSPVSKALKKIRSKALKYME